MEKRLRLTGKCALVTGSSTGIGRAIALRFAEEGARVAVNYSKSEEDANEVVAEIIKLGGSSISVRADVSKTREVDTLVAEVVRRLGKVDILVNNAGVFIGRSLDQTSEDIWDKVLDTNLKGAFLCARRCAPEMLGVGRGKIINIASIDSFISEPDALAYCASKAGLVGFTTALALELAPKKINVNAIAPGWIKTPMTKSLNNAALRNVISRTPFGRIGRPDDIASTAAFLASEESDFINGAVIVVDGGWMLQ